MTSCQFLEQIWTEVVQMSRAYLVVSEMNSQHIFFLDSLLGVSGGRGLRNQASSNLGMLLKMTFKWTPQDCFFPTQPCSKLSNL